MADQDDDILIWYVAYGSNLLESRFHDYQRGGRRRSGTVMTQQEWTESPSSRPGRLPYQLYFAGDFPGWNGSAGAFIDVTKETEFETWTREYLITWRQFKALFRDENLTAGSTVVIPDVTLAQALADGIDLDPGLDKRLPYGRVKALERDIDGRSRLTITSSKPSPKRRAISVAYLQTIVEGLREAHPELTDMDILDYFARVPGVGRAVFTSTEPEVEETAAVRSDRARAWEVVEAAVARMAGPRTSVAIVGGGIAGLYCAYELGRRHGFEITVYEASSRFGGRIETETLGGYKAEFGPMRFELQIQPLVKKLVEEDLGLKFNDFPTTSNDEASARTGSSRYALHHDELRHGRDVVGNPDPDPPPLATMPLDLLRLGVLRIFRQDVWDSLPAGKLGYKDIGELDLCVDTTTRPPSGAKEMSPGKFEADAGAWSIAPAPINATQSTSDRSMQQRLRIHVQAWLDSLDDCAYDTLRRNSRHRTAQSAGQDAKRDAGTSGGALDDPKGHLLRDEGFWNAMGEELSPPALSFIRNEGTFYHLIPENPNAVEWGIFWLRLLRKDAEQLSGIKTGTESLVERLTERFRGHSHITLRSAQEVLEVAPGMGARPLMLTIQDRRDNHAYTVEADHCVLALPLAPVRRLAGHFPIQIREDLTQTFGFALLKCFLVVNEPWWCYGMLPQSGAGGVPTRELHFKRRSPDWMIGDEQKPFIETTGDEGTGMVMVYTDNPASQFWRPFVKSPIHNQAEINEGPDFKRALALHLLINARREAHRDLTTLLLDEVARKSTELSTWNDARVVARRFARAVREWVPKQKSQVLLKDWYELLVSEAPLVLTVENFERILDVLRHPGFDTMATACDRVRGAVYTELSQLNSSGSTGSGIDFASTSLSVVFPESFTNGPITNGREKPLDRQVDEALNQVVTWGIRDWARLPVGAGCHAWSIGARSWEVMGRLDAFTLVGRSPTHPVRTVHICGEAVSDYTGFIEGALRSAGRVVNAILTG